MDVRYGYKTNRISSDLENRPWVHPVRDFVLWLLFLIALIGGLTFRTVTKTVSIGERLTDYVEYNSEVAENSEWTVMQPMMSNSGKGFIVSLPTGTRADSIYVGNYYQDHALLIKVKGAKSTMFGADRILGDVSHIVTAAFRDYNGELCISVQMDGLWEYEISQENNQLYVVPYKAEEKYSKSVVIIPGFRDGEEDVTGKIAELASTMLSSEGIRIYSTRAVGRNKNAEEILSFIEEANADVVIAIDLSSSEDITLYGQSAFYNRDYFIPEMNNGLVAETFLRNITTFANGRAESIDDADSNSILRVIRRPAAQVNVGYSTNIKEYELLKNEKYQKQIAEGIASAAKELLIVTE